MTQSTPPTTAAQHAPAPSNDQQIPPKTVQDRTNPNKRIQKSLRKPEKT